MTLIIAVMSGKGGVGKTSIAAMIAQIFSEKYRTIALDFDICGPSLTRALGVKGAVIKISTGFKPLPVKDSLDALSFGSILQPTDVVIWRGAKKLMFINLFYNSVVGYDCVVIDTPPGISEEHEFLIGKDVRVITVTTPQNIALNDTQRCIEFCKINGMEILGLVENMSWLQCECCHETYHLFGSLGGRQLAEEYSINFLGELEVEPSWSEMIDQGSFSETYKDLKTYQSLKKILLNLKLL